MIGGADGTPTRPTCGATTLARSARRRRSTAPKSASTSRRSARRWQRSASATRPACTPSTSPAARPSSSGPIGYGNRRSDRPRRAWHAAGGRSAVHRVTPTRLLDTREGGTKPGAGSTTRSAGHRRRRRAGQRDGGRAEHDRHRGDGRRLRHRLPDRRGLPTVSNHNLDDRRDARPTWSTIKIGAGGKVSIFTPERSAHRSPTCSATTPQPTGTAGRFTALHARPIDRHP